MRLIQIELKIFAENSVFNKKYCDLKFLNLSQIER